MNMNIECKTCLKSSEYCCEVCDNKCENCYNCYVYTESYCSEEYCHFLTKKLMFRYPSDNYCECFDHWEGTYECKYCKDLEDFNKKFIRKCMGCGNKCDIREICEICTYSAQCQNCGTMYDSRKICKCIHYEQCQDCGYLYDTRKKTHTVCQVREDRDCVYNNTMTTLLDNLPRTGSVDCVCGGRFSRKTKIRHFSTIKHITYIDNNCNYTHNHHRHHHYHHLE